MRIVRYAYERNTRRYELEIDIDYIETMNCNLDRYMGDVPHPAITINMVAAVAQCESDWDTFPELEFHVDSFETLEEWIWDYINDDVWCSDNDIVDGETDDWEDDVELDADEEESYKEYVQKVTLDDEVSPEGANYANELEDE